MLPDVFENIGRQLAGQNQRLEALERQEEALGWTLIEDALPVGVNSVDFLNIPTTFRHLVIINYLRSTVVAANDNLLMRFNNDLGLNYDWLLTTGAHPNSFLTAEGIVNTSILITSFAGSTVPGNAFDVSIIYIPDYKSTTGEKAVRQNSTRKSANSTGNIRVDQVSGWWRNIAAINRITFLSATASNFAAGSQMSLYGIK